MKLTEKQKELINLALETEKEINDQVYFRWNPFSKQIFIVQLIKDGEKLATKFLKQVNGRIAYKLEEKGLLIPEVIEGGIKLNKLNKELLI